MIPKRSLNYLSLRFSFYTGITAVITVSKKVKTNSKESTKSFVEFFNEDYLTDKAVSEIIGCSQQALKQWRIMDPPRGPPFVRFGRLVRYPRGNLIRWIASRPTGGEIVRIAQHRQPAPQK